MDNRKTWHEYFMSIAVLAAQRSTCIRRQVGAIAVRDKRIISTGYNGAPCGVTHCLDIGCLRDALCVPSGQRHEICRAVHAEQNVIIQAAFNGVSINGATIYCTTYPCSICAKMLINCGIKDIYYSGAYNDKMSASLLSDARIKIIKI